MKISRLAPLLILSLLLMLLSCKKDNLRKVQLLTDEKVYPLETGTDVVFLYSDSGRVRAKLLCPLMEKFAGKEPYVEMAKGIEITFYEGDSIPKGYLRANYAIQYPNRRTIEVKNDVVVVNVKGDTLNTEHLTWEENKARIFSNNFVRVKTKDEIILSQGFESNETFSKYTFKNIRGTIQLNTGLEE